MDNMYQEELRLYRRDSDRVKTDYIRRKYLALNTHKRVNAISIITAALATLPLLTTQMYA